MRRTTGTLATTLVLVATLAACGGDPEPRFQEEPSAAPSASPPSASAEPEAWEERTDDGAVAFVEHWLVLFREAENSGETDPLLDASSTECESCIRFADEIARVYTQGGTIQSDGWSLISAADPIRQRGVTSVAFEVLQSDQRLQETADSEPVVNRGIKIGLAAELSWKGGRWRMDRLDIVR